MWYKQSGVCFKNGCIKSRIGEATSEIEDENVDKIADEINELVKDIVKDKNQ